MTAPAPTQTPPKPMFADHMEFFSWFARTFRRDLRDDNKFAWCNEWWRHAEAVQIIKALHESFEQHWGPKGKPRGNARAEWLTYFCYPLINRLFDPLGVFNGCSYQPGGHIAQPRWVLPMATDPSGQYPVD